MKGFLQVIKDGSQSDASVRSRMEGVPGLALSRVEDHGSSILMQFTYRAGDLLALENALAAHYFTSDLF
ncbi:hypothetical protein [Roseivivax sp. CAU 1761]